MSFEHNNVRKNLFLSACFCVGILGFLYMRWTKNLNLVDSLVMEIPNWALYFVTPEYSDYTQYYAVLSHSGKGPGYCYMIGRGPNSCLLGHMTGLLFRLYVKLFLPSIFNSVDFRSSMSLIVLDVELTEKNVIEELGIFIDGSLQGFSFCPPKTFKPNKQTSWNTKHLHGNA